MSDLLPCPFCGGKAEFNQTEDGGHFIECTKCGSSTILRYSLMEDARSILAESWNYRAQLAAPASEPMMPVPTSADQAHGMVNMGLMFLKENAPERLLATPADLVRRLLADHQRVEPHHADMCALCREATAAIEGQPAPGERKPSYCGYCAFPLTLCRCAQGEPMVSVAEMNRRIAQGERQPEAIDRLVTMFCSAVDNLGDMPVSEEWADKWSREGSDLLHDNNYFHALTK